MWGAVYLAAVGIASVLNQVLGGAVVWYAASVILTLPLSWLLIYPILFLANWTSTATGGDAMTGNFYSAAMVVLAFVGLAVINLMLARAIADWWLSMHRRRRHSASQAGTAGR